MKRQWLNTNPEIVEIENLSMVSESFKCPEYSIEISTPLCNACKKLHDGRKSCDAYKNLPDEYAWGDRYDCPYVDLDQASFIYPDVKQSLDEWNEAQKQQ